MPANTCFQIHHNLAIASSNNIYVIDKLNIVVFDQYGNGISHNKCGQET